VEAQNGASKTTNEINDKNWLKKQFIPSQAFHRTTGGHIREITSRKPFEPQILELFNPVAQESNWASPATIHTRWKNKSQLQSWLQLHKLELAVALPRDLGKQTGIWLMHKQPKAKTQKSRRNGDWSQ
jgi:hypothetical protein